MNQEKEIPTANMLIKTIFGISGDAKDLTPMDKGECKRLMIEFAKLHRSNLIECFSERTSLSKEFLNGFYPESNIK